RNKQTKAVDAYVVHPQKLQNEISVAGTLLAFDEVELKNEVSGRIVELNLPEGQFVKKGTLLVKLYDGDLQANLNKLNAQLSTQQQVYQRQAELFKVNGISRNELENAALNVSVLQAEIAGVEAQIRKTEILAPFDGIVGLRNVSIGAVVNTSTVLASLRSSAKLKLDFYIPERYASAIVKGMKVWFTLFSSEVKYEATVLATETRIETGTRELKVRAVTDNISEVLVPGSFATVYLGLGSNEKALLVPTQCIIPKEQTKRLIVARNGKAEFVTVTTGVRQSNNIEILQGLSEGDTVITTGVLFLKPGSVIKYAHISDSL
ncbi:MAG TPA: efflux RND transporter periplasmic adaptor subunit, partial [Bacteroidales bacterium]|nr:efflux RND transporter periplasmic adaptor subunit [Bacteroidales bacterium]